MVLKDGLWKYFLDGQEVTESAYLQRHPAPKEESKVLPKLRSGYPFKCQALGCHAKQVNELKAKCERLKVPTEVTPQGDLVIRSESHYKQLRKAFGVHHRNAYDD